MSNLATTDKKKTIQGLLEGPQFHEAVQKSLPTHLKPDRFIRIALTALNRTPKLLECTRESLFECLLTLSQFGLEPDGRRAHLIPYGNKCTLIVDYKGLAELAMRSGVISNLHADVVCENDDFEFDRGAVLRHKIDFRKDRGAVYAVYAIARFKDGSEKADAMGQAEVEAVRKRSRSGSNGPWVTDWNEMAKKTVFRRLSKWLPLSPEFRDAIEADDEEKALAAAKPVFDHKTGSSFLKEPDAASELPDRQEVPGDGSESPQTPDSGESGPSERATPLQAIENLCRTSEITMAQLEKYLRGTGWLPASKDLGMCNDKKLGEVIGGFPAALVEIRAEVVE